MGRLELKLLGGFDVRLGEGDSLNLPTRKAKALFAYLAMPAGQTHSREQLRALLWGDRAEAQARASFRQALTTIRKAVAGPGLLIEGETIALDPNAVSVDVAHFERLARESTPDTLRQAADLYRGDLLAGLNVDESPYEQWRTERGEGLHELAVEALARLLAFEAGEGPAEAAIGTALRLLSLDPVQEPVHRTLMHLYVRQGRRAAALRQYQTCVEVLRRELGAQPEIETQDLFQRIVGREPLGSEPSIAMLAGRRPGGRQRSATGSGSGTLAGVGVIGRRHETERLEATLERAWTDGGRLVIVRGEAGVGKTRLLEELATAARARGGQIYSGRGYETQQVLPFRPWVDAIRTARLLGHPDLVAALGPSKRGRLARLFPELADASIEPPPAGEDHSALFEAVGDLLSRCAAREPLLIILDDLQWADESSLRLLAFLVRHLGDLPVLLAAGLRDEDLDGSPLLGQVVRELQAGGCADVVGLLPLRRKEMDTLVRALVGPRSEDSAAEIADHVWAVSEGNPFVAVEAIHAIVDLPDAPSERTIHLPGTVREFLEARLSRLSEIPQHLLAVAAVIGHACSFELLQRAAGLGSRDAADAVEELVRRRLLLAVGERFQFPHDRLRQVAYERLLPARKAVLHGAVTAALEALAARRLGEVADELAHHSSRAGNVDRVVTYLALFAETAQQRYALDDAAQALDLALEHVDQLPLESREARRIDLVIRKALVLSLQARFADIPLLLLPHQATVAALGDPLLTGPFHCRLSITHTYRAEYDRARGEAAKALDAAEACGDDVTAGQAHYVLGLAEFFLGRPGPGLAHAERAIVLLTRARLQHYLGLTYFVLGCSHHLLGDFDRALAAHAECEAIGAATGDARLRSFAAFATAWVLAARGDWTRALEMSRESLAGAREPLSIGGAKAYMGFAYVEMGNPAAALPLLDEAVDFFRRVGLRPSEGRFRVFLSEAYLALGDVARARNQAQRAQSLNAEIGAAWALALATRTLGRIALTARDLDEAARRLGEAAAAFAAIPAPFDGAQTAVDLARLASARGCPSEATARLREATAVFRQAGAPRHVERVEEVARALAAAAPLDA